MKKIKISAREFRCYCHAKNWEVIPIWDIEGYSQICNIDSEKIVAIIKNYDFLESTFKQKKRIIIESSVSVIEKYINRL